MEAKFAQIIHMSAEQFRISLHWAIPADTDTSSFGKNKMYVHSEED